MGYIIRKRIDSACNRMRCGGMNVTEAAFASGFNDPSCFYRRFRALKGIMPRMYMTEGAKGYGRSFMRRQIMSTAGFTR